ncbi:serine hydrolase domain-containing protein [Chiayiivirga flava]|uniref:Beta-lactamase class C n=1 Tax=Chiayiivirga flava TaxID=659595 RepID=A0A7W8D6H2_9GAMM|nr:serine hydrolase domain-containing protein [Chiayiivirga flava]MBB5208826.1 beta-lactamase class C [Chiayiivirga flava]
MPRTIVRLPTLPRVTRGVLAATLLALLLPTAQADNAGQPRPLAASHRALLSERDQGALATRIEALGQRIIDDAKVSGMAIAIVQDDQVLLERGFGVVQVGRRDPVDADTAFRLASLSKAFAGTLTALLVRDGALRWDTRIADHLPAFKLRNMQQAQTLTVKDILSHRVGLPHNTHDRLLEDDEPYPLLAARLAEAKPICDAGQCYSYQNIAFSLIGDMTFAATGDFYSHQVEKRIFHPLGMYGATFGREALEASPSWARPHVKARGGGWMPVRPKENYYRIPPAAGVNASIRDLSVWLRAQLGEYPDVLSDDVLASVQAPLVETPGETTASPWRRERLRGAHYALGWRVYDYAGHTVVYHAGAVQGYRAMIAFLPDNGFGMAVVWNCESAVPSGLLPTALDRYLGLPQQDWLELDRFKTRTRKRG